MSILGSQDSFRDFKAMTLEELRKLSLEELRFLAEDLRQTILSTCLKNGGHLGASLGAVEIAIALHYVFHSPKEPLVWDVGHQAYAHKLLTGRWNRFGSLRLKSGVSGFLSRQESEHDVFGAGHSSTALSAALAMAWARKRGAQEGEPLWTVAIVGDGGLTAGLSFEAINQFRDTQLGPFLLLINDNQMSISKNSGAIAAILSNRDEASGFFHSFGFNYLGPVDGHDLGALIGTLQGIRSSGIEKPVVLHVMTQKGKGYIPAEERPETFHGISPVKVSPPHQKSKEVQKASSANITYSQAFGDALCRLAEKDPKVIAITAAMTEGTGLSQFARLFPERFFDVGIAEAHAVTFAAGLATQGYKPVVAIYSTFLQRSLDQIIHDVALQNLGVIFAVDRAGIVGPDGPTHHGAFDLSYLSLVPGMNVSAPISLQDLETTLEEALKAGVPWAIRYPRGSGPNTFPDALASPSGRNPGVHWVKESNDCRLIVVALGSAAHRTHRGFEQLDSKLKAQVSFFALTQLKPLPDEVIEYCRLHPQAAVLTVEDGSVMGGLGQQLLSAIREHSGRFEIDAYSDRFIPHGSIQELEELEGLTPAQLAQKMQRLLEQA